MNWLHIHKWKLVAICNKSGYHPRPDIEWHYSIFLYVCSSCGTHKQKVFSGHFDMPDEQKDKEVAELNKMMGIKP